MPLIFCCIMHLFIISKVKTWKLALNFPIRKNCWHMTGMDIPSAKIPSYKHGSVRNMFFVKSQRLNMAELGQSCTRST